MAARRDELDRPLERGKGSVGPSAFVQVATEPVVQARRAQPISLVDEIDCSLRELHRAWRRPRLAGELGCPGAELGEVEPRELGRIRHGIPQSQRPLEVRASLREPKNGLCVTRRFDRGDERLRVATCGRPVGRELRR